MTPAQANEIIRLATMLAIEAPQRQGRFSVSATVSWRTMHSLRDALTAAGVDLPALFRQMRTIRAEIQADAARARAEGRP